jgi:outer membrane protein assembly factor BamD
MKFFIFLFSVVLLVSSCGGLQKPENNSAEQVYNKGVELFNEAEYLDAKQYFDIIKLQYPASQFADDAQWYMSEIHFMREEYILAAFNYSMLRRVYPGSDYSKESLYRNALCYYNLSPNFDRDPEYTNKAIEAFMEFQYLYPDDSLNVESSKKIVSLRDKLAYRDFFTAELYIKMGSPRASIVYFDAVINNFSDSKYYEDAYIGKIEALYFMKKYEQTISIIRAYATQFPNGKALSRNNQIANEINSLSQKQNDKTE